jgi:pimeloyl-ACP methyl ester carboxylesterase
MCSLSHWSRKATSFSSYINKWISTRDSSTLKRVSVSLSENLALNVILPNESLAQENSTSTPLLCIPSAFGSAEHNFKQQFEVFADKFPMVAIDPRGYGGSRPPVRDFPANYFERDAQDIALAMEKLGYEKVSEGSILYILNACTHAKYLCDVSTIF